MNSVNLIPYVYEQLMVFILALSRITALFSTFVLFRKDFVNARFVISLSLILAFYTVWLHNNVRLAYDFYSLKMLADVMFQSLIGFMIGLALNIVFDVFFSSRSNYFDTSGLGDG